MTTSAHGARNRGTPKTVNLNGLLKPGQKVEARASVAATEVADEPFTEGELRDAWVEFAEQRKNFQAEHQLLSQPYVLREKNIIVNLLSPVHDTMLNNIKIELTTFLRERLKNNAIQVTGELTATDDKKVIYTNREKFEYLSDKNPMIKELKERLGLDADF